MGRVIGYCRVSTENQNLEMQEQPILKYADEKGLELILHVEKISERQELDHAMKAATVGGTSIQLQVNWFIPKRIKK